MIVGQLLTVSFNQLLKIELEPKEYILHPIIPEQGLAMIHAKAGVGKTFVALGITYAVATGGSFLDWKAPKPRGVLYVDGEMPASAMQERIQQIHQANGSPDIDIPIDFITYDFQDLMYMPDISYEEGQQLINNAIAEDTELIIIDNLSCLSSGKENESESWLPIARWLLSLRKRKISVLLLHHSGKHGLQRGTSKKEDILDTVIMLDKNIYNGVSKGASFQVVYEKNRGFYGEDAEPFHAELIDGQWETSSNKSNSRNYPKILELHKSGITKQVEIAEQLGIDKGTVSRNIKKAKENGDITT